MNKKRINLNLFTIILIVIVALYSVYFTVPKYFADDIYPLKYTAFIVKYSRECNVDPALVSAVILQESRFNPNANSSAGAQGLMQFMPGTARTMARELGVTNYNIYDPETSIYFGACHLRDLLVKYNGNVESALAGYNAGTGNADRWIARNLIARDMIPSRETSNYVKRVTNYQRIYRTMYATELGLESIKLEKSDQNSQIRSFVWRQIFSNIFKNFN